MSGHEQDGISSNNYTETMKRGRRALSREHEPLSHILILLSSWLWLGREAGAREKINSRPGLAKCTSHSEGLSSVSEARYATG